MPRLSDRGQHGLCLYGLYLVTFLKPLHTHRGVCCCKVVFLCVFVIPKVLSGFCLLVSYDCSCKDLSSRWQMEESKERFSTETEQSVFQDHFEKLPDELIVAVLSHLSPEDIVSNVARVCKRWQSIAKDPKVWGTSCLRFSHGYAKKFREIVQFTPYLHRLEFQWYVPSARDVDAVLSGCTFVKSLKWCPSSDGNNEDILKHLNKIICHCKYSLQEIDIFLSDSVVSSSLEHPYNILQKSTFNILSSMNSLKSFKLRGYVSHIVLQQDIFKQGWRALECVDFFQLSVPECDELKGLFIMSLLRHTAHKLKRLFFPSDMFYLCSFPGFYDACKSSTLKAVRVCESALPVIRNLSGLEMLHVMGLSLKNHSDWKASFSSPQLYCRVYDWIREEQEFSNVKNLILENVNDDARNLIKNLFAACKELQYLTLCGGNYSSSQLMEILKDQQALKHLRVHHVTSLNSNHLKLIPICLPNLRVLDLRYCVFKTDGVFMNYQEEVQRRMPYLKLYTDWGTFDIRGAKLFNRSNQICSFASGNNFLRGSPQFCYNSEGHMAEVVKMLDEFSDYDDNSDSSKS